MYTFKRQVTQLEGRLNALTLLNVFFLIFDVC